MPPRGSHPLAFIEPMTAKVVKALPEGDEWLYEVKWDGYRALLLKDGDSVRILSRNNNDLTAAYPAVRAAASRLEADSAILDGEIVALDRDGRPSFQALQHRRAHAGHVIAFYAFDLLYLNGEDLTRRPLHERIARLPAIVTGSGILLSSPLPGTAAHVTDAVARLGLEGVIAKRKNSRYDANQRGDVWVKLKLDRQQEFIVGGYRPGTYGVDALLVGVYEGRHLKFAGKVRAGFTPHLRRDVFERLKPLHTDRCPFVNLPTTKTSRWGSGVTADEMEEMQWVAPKLVAQIRFVEWTADGQLRHSAFLGVRDDKAAADVRRET